MESFHIKPGKVKITDRSLQTCLKYLAKAHGIKYKNLKFKMDYSDPITFVNCYNSVLNLNYITLPKLSYHAISLKKESLSLSRIVANACILAFINYCPNLPDIYCMRYFILWICRAYSVRTKNNLINSNITVNELLDLTCKTLLEWQANQLDIYYMIEQSKKNCGKTKTTTIGGNLSKKEKQSMSNQKFTAAERSFIVELRKQGNSYSNIEKQFKLSYNKKISRTTVIRICKEIPETPKIKSISIEDVLNSL